MKIIISILISIMTLSAWAGGSGNGGGGSTLMPGGLLNVEVSTNLIIMDPKLGTQRAPDLGSIWEQDIYINPENPSAAYMSEAAKELARMIEGKNTTSASSYVRHIALDGAETVYQTGQLAKSGKIQVQQHVKPLDEIQTYPKSFRDSYMKSFASQQNLWVPIKDPAKVKMPGYNSGGIARDRGISHKIYLEP